MKNFRVGQHIKFRSDLDPNKSYEIFLNHSMAEMRGKHATISEIMTYCNWHFKINDDNGYIYTRDMVSDFFKYGK